ncbi:MAG: thioredoxin fold domain-containing protein [Deltaproteobacteria bacterium]|nr:thioredoxin fold domain-containing protein [Deltaproteobacteria bacterium]
MAAKTRMLFFYQDGCHWCVQMDEILHEPEVSGLLLRHTQIIRVDVHGRNKVAALGKTGISLTKEFKVYGTPTIILLGDGGKVLLRIPGVLTRKDFLDVICHYIPGMQKKKDCVERVSAL